MDVYCDISLSVVFIHSDPFEKVKKGLSSLPLLGELFVLTLAYLKEVKIMQNNPLLTVMRLFRNYILKPHRLGGIMID